MAKFKARVERLEKLQPQELEEFLKQLSDEELNNLLEQFLNKPELRSWLADSSNNDPMRLCTIETMNDLDISFETYCNVDKH